MLRIEKSETASLATNLQRTTDSLISTYRTRLRLRYGVVKVIQLEGFVLLIILEVIPLNLPPRLATGRVN